MVICRSQPRAKKLKMIFPDYEKEKDIISYEVVDVVESTGETNRDFIVKQEVVETSRVNRQNYFDEQAKGHSIYEIIDKVLLTGDRTLLLKGDSGLYGDFSKMPMDQADAFANREAIIAALNKLDPELVGDDLYKFLQKVTPEDVEKFYADKAAAAASANKEGGAE